MTDHADPAPLAREYRCAAPPPPKNVELALRHRDNAEIDPAFYRRILREMRELGIEVLGLACLGEPFLCRWLAEAIRFAKEDCGYRRVYATTGGRAAVAPRVRQCMEAGLDSLEFRFGFDIDEFHEVTGSASDFGQVMENLKGARRVRDEVAAATGHRCGLHASSLRRSDGGRAGQPPPLARILPWVDEHVRLAGEAPPPLPCRSLFIEGHVTCEGRLAGCGAHDDARFDMGDLVHHGFMRAWHSEPFQRLRRAHLAGNIAASACGSYCPGRLAVTQPGRLDRSR